jgi:hypothetical protein
MLIAVAVILAAGLVGWRLCRPPALYRVTILPSLGGWHIEAHSLNDHGQVAGVEYVGRNQHLFLWERMHGIQDLGPVTENPLTINNAGQISGTMPADSNSLKAFLWEPGKGRTLLGTLGGRTSTAMAMNNRGQIIGLSPDSAGLIRAFCWDKETGMRELTAPDGSRCDPVSINDAGQILVMALQKPLVLPGPWFLLDPNGPKSLNPIPPDTWLSSINAGSCMVGIERSAGVLTRLLIRNKQGTWRRLFPMNSHGDVTRLNDKNQIAYTEFTDSRWKDLLERFFHRPFQRSDAESYLWDPVRGRIPLNRYVRGVKQFIVQDLNNEGCIVGTADLEDGTMRPVLLEPIPERWGK